MGLPFFSLQPQNLVNCEPIYSDLYEVIIINNDIDFILKDVINANFVNGSLVISIRTEYQKREADMRYINKYFREDKLNRLIDGDSREDYRIILSIFDSKGDVKRRLNFLESKFIGNSENMFHFSYKLKEVVI